MYSINAYHFRHPAHGDVMIDAGFSDDFYRRPPYGNLGPVIKFFQKINNVKYMQEENQGIELQLKRRGISPDHIFLTHRHPDHTSGLSEPDNLSRTRCCRYRHCFQRAWRWAGGP